MNGLFPPSTSPLSQRLPEEVVTHILAFLLPLHHAASIAARFPDNRMDNIDAMYADEGGYAAHVAAEDPISRLTARSAARDLLRFSLADRWARNMVVSGSVPLWKPLYLRLWSWSEAENERRRIQDNIAQLKPGATKPDYYRLILERTQVDITVFDTISKAGHANHGGSRIVSRAIALHGSDAFDRLTDLSRSVGEFPRPLRTLYLEACIGPDAPRSSRQSISPMRASMAFVAGRTGLGLLPFAEAQHALDPAINARWHGVTQADEIMPGTFPERSQVEMEQDAAPGPYLSIRSWADEMRNHLLKLSALRTWQAMIHGENVSFEDGLLAFSAFRGGDPIEVKNTFGRWARYISDYWVIRWAHRDHRGALVNDPVLENLEGMPGDLERFYEMVGRLLAFAGIRPALGLEFHEIDGAFCHIILGNRKYTLPMTLAVIWVAILQRLGLDASPINSPGQIMIVISGVISGSWAATNLNTAHYNFPHWIRFYTSNAILDRHEMVRHLESILGGIGEDAILEPACTLSMVGRTARNIAVSLSNQASRFPEQDVADSAQAAAVAWICVYLSPGDSDLHHNISLALNGLRWLAGLLSSGKAAWLDRPLLEEVLRLIEPVTFDAVVRGRQELRSELDSKVAQEEERQGAKMECVQAMSEGKMYFPGTFMKHVKYNYIGVVTGGDAACTQSEEWIRVMGIDSLAHGRHQPFYHVQNSTGGMTYVAHQNIVPYSEESPISDMQIYQLLHLHPSLGLIFDRIDLVRSRAVPSPSLLALYPAAAS